MSEHKHWSTPYLIVLVRGHAEERVLLVCKTHGNPVGDPGTSNSTCKPGNAGSHPCPDACQGVTGS